MSVVISTQRITPELARELLGQNQENRKLDVAIVGVYRRDMLAGRWLFSADPIQFSAAGRLLNGQHRLNAIASIEDDEFGIEFVIVRGLEEDSQKVMDQGRKRQASQHLQMLGVKNSINVAAASRTVINLDRRALFRDNRFLRVSAAEVHEWVSNNLELVENHNRNMLSIRHTPAKPAVAGAAYMVLARLGDVPLADEFIGLFGSGAGLSAGDPILAVREQLRRWKDRRRRVSEREQLALLFLAWNRWTAGKRLSRVATPSEGWNERNFPFPVAS